MCPICWVRPPALRPSRWVRLPACASGRPHRCIICGRIFMGRPPGVSSTCASKHPCCQGCLYRFFLAQDDMGVPPSCPVCRTPWHPPVDGEEKYVGPL